jgi:plastocyanin
MPRHSGPLLAVVVLLCASLGFAPGVSAAGTVRTAKLSGAHEVPAVATQGTGSATITISDDGSSIAYSITYSGLSGPVVAAHIHVADIGSNGPVLLPFTVGPSPMTGTLTAANNTGANGLTFAQVVDKIKTGGAYVNLHTAAHPGGEIRGQLYDASATQTYVIAADAPEAVPAGRIWAYNDFFPRSLSVAQGSIVKFAIKGFHTATILPTGMTAAQDFAAGGSVVANDTDDTELNANGTKKTVFNLPALSPILPSPTCGTDASPCSFTGTSILSESPLFAGPPGAPPPSAPPPPTAIKVDAPAGTYVFHCRIHPEMNASLTVLAAGSTEGASPDDVASASAAQVAADTAAATATFNAKNKATRQINSNGSSTWIVNLGAETPDHKVDILEMLPAKITIKSGDRVVWRVQGRNEPHTVTFPRDLETDSVPKCEGANGQDVPCTGPPDEIEIGGGNGVSTVKSPTTVSDSGLLLAAVSAAALGADPAGALHKWRVSFAGAVKGTYKYVCQIHDGMNGFVTVR